MTTVTIGQETKALGEATEQWINQQIVRRRRDGGSLCVQVKVEKPQINMVLSTPQCIRNGFGGRPPSEQERRIFELWDRRGLNQPDFTGGNLIAFLKQLNA